MRFAYRPVEAGFGRRRGHHLDVIWHQAVAPDFHFTGCAPFSHEFKINLEINLPEESLLTPIATLRDVVMHPGLKRGRESF